MEAKKRHIIYKEDFKRQAVEMVIHSGKTQVQVARELGCSEYSLTLWRKKYFKTQVPGQVAGQPSSPEQLFEEIRRLQKENEYLKRQREILKKAMSILGEEPSSGMR
jgi:transposase